MPPIGMKQDRQLRPVAAHIPAKCEVAPPADLRKAPGVVVHVHVSGHAATGSTERGVPVAVRPIAVSGTVSVI